MCIMPGGESPPQTQFSARIMNILVCEGWYIHHQTRIISVYCIQRLLPNIKSIRVTIEVSSSN